MKTHSSLLAPILFVASLSVVTPAVVAQNRVVSVVRTVPDAAPVATAGSANQSLAANPASSAAVNPQARCHWWQFGRCDEQHDAMEGFPDGAPRTGVVVTVDVSSNQLYLFKDAQLIDKSPAATGTGKLLRHGRRIWMFHTPQGHLKVLRKVVDPIWTKPDWAFVEDRQPIPPPDSPRRQIRGHLGKYALDLGDGIMIHGTQDPASIGRRASHGCIRLPDQMLEKVYSTASIGTDVFIFQSQAPQIAENRSGVPEHHSDLDVK